MSLTVSDIKRIRKQKPKRFGAKVDYRLKSELRESEIDPLLEKLNTLVSDLGLTLSGFGYVNYSGIMSSEDSKEVLRKKLKKVKNWQAKHQSFFKLFITGKVQLIDDIFYE